MPHIAPPDYPPPTILNVVAGIVRDISDDFYDLYDKLKDVWLLGQWLRWPFWWLHRYFKNVSDNIYLADTLLREFKQWIDGIKDANVFERLLDWLSSEYRSIRSDPVGWARRKFQAISHEAWQILNVPNTWVHDRISQWVPWWTDFRRNPRQFIIDKLIAAYPWLINFLGNALAYIVENVYAGIGFMRQLRDNPQQRIIDWLSVWYAWIRSFLTDPMQFIIGQIKQYSVELRLIVEDPYAWVRQKIKNIMGWSDIDISDLGFYIFNRFLQRANDYVERRYTAVRDVAINIIMRFM